MVGPIIPTLSNATSSSRRREPGLRPARIACPKSSLPIHQNFPSPELTSSPSKMMRKTTLWTPFLCLLIVKVLGLGGTSLGTAHGSGLTAPSGHMTTGSAARMSGRTVSSSRPMVTGMWAGSQISCVVMCVNIWIWINSLNDYDIWCMMFNIFNKLASIGIFIHIFCQALVQVPVSWQSRIFSPVQKNRFKSLEDIWYICDKTVILGRKHLTVLHLIFLYISFTPHPHQSNQCKKLSPLLSCSMHALLLCSRFSKKILF